MKRKNFPNRKEMRRLEAIVMQQNSYESLRKSFENLKRNYFASPENTRYIGGVDMESYYSNTFEQNYGTFEQRYGSRAA